LNKDLGFSAEDRAENIRRISEVSKLFALSGQIVFVAFISPYSKDRNFAKEIH
jgi:3'-phosphoadenosine 5'-phosphosulfate synthase